MSHWSADYIDVDTESTEELKKELRNKLDKDWDIELRGDNGPIIITNPNSTDKITVVKFTNMGNNFVTEHTNDDSRKAQRTERFPIGQDGFKYTIQVVNQILRNAS